MTLTLRKTFIGGETHDDDYAVLWNGVDVGRIFIQPGVPMGRPNWNWGIVIRGEPQMTDWRGLAGSLDEAKAAFKARWERLDDKLKP